MTDYLLDANICIAMMAGDRQVHAHVANIDPVNIAVPVVVAFELWFGTYKSERPEVSFRRLEIFFRQIPTVLEMNSEDARRSGMLRHDLQRMRQPIGHYDTLIAGQALSRDRVLVTANEREFGRIKELRWENWTKPR